MWWVSLLQGECVEKSWTSFGGSTVMECFCTSVGLVTQDQEASRHKTEERLRPVLHAVKRWWTQHIHLQFPSQGAKVIRWGGAGTRQRWGRASCRETHTTCAHMEFSLCTGCVQKFLHALKLKDHGFHRLQVTICLKGGVSPWISFGPGFFTPGLGAQW